MDCTPGKHARFSLTYTVAILIGTIVIAIGVQPVKLTMLTMALNAMALPIVSIPFLLLMNDRRVLKERANGPLMNIATVAIIAISLVMFVVSLPLVVMGS